MEEEDDYEEYVPVAKRRAMEAQKILQRKGKIVQQEKEMIENLPDNKTLKSVRELAKGITYTEPLPTGWKPPWHIRRMSKKDCDLIQKQWHIIVDGEEIPPPVKNFKDMRFPDPILKMLKTK
ncbi:DEAD-box ATP-dependent RNA helicase 35-like protein, partial [Trifolium pratense]